MISLEKELALIGCANELLLRGQNPFINFGIVFQYARMMEARSGYAVVLGFSQETLERLLSKHQELFQHDLVRSAEYGQKTYRILIEGAERGQQIWPALDIVQHIQKMLDILDPALNYPLPFLDEMRLLPALQGSL